MKTLNNSSIKSITGGLAYTGGDYLEWLELIRQNPGLYNV